MLGLLLCGLSLHMPLEKFHVSKWKFGFLFKKNNEVLSIPVHDKPE